MLHFAYGSNMDRGIMRRHAPEAVAIGVALLADRRFVISSDGYASVVPTRGQSVYGVLWRLTPRDRVTLDRWECIASGQYRAETLQVRVVGGLRQALVYVARPHFGIGTRGRPKPDYMELVLAAARSWELPAGYVASLQVWLLRSLGAGTRKLRELECT
ncbi:MAG: gamma-glutamylcyclotransferase family protein [Xanthobacteraceae bacterium]